jgi:hypothetical protein
VGEELEGPELLPAHSRRPVPAHRHPVRRARPQRHRLGSDRAALRRPDAGRAVGRRREDFLGDVAAPAVDVLAAQQLLQGVKAFREVGRVIRTIQLLRYLSDPQLRRRTTAATNKVESYNNFSAWCSFGNEGRVRDNDPAEQEKQIKFSTLLTNAVIFHTTLDMMAVLRQLAAEGWERSNPRT